MAYTKELLLGQEEQQGNNPIDCTAFEAPQATSLAEAVRVACASLGIEHDVAESIVGGTVARMRTVVGFAEIEEVARTVLPGASFTRMLHVHPGDYRAHLPTLAQAQEAAAAIIAEYGGSVEVSRFDNPCVSGVVGSVQVVTYGIDTAIFFFDEEVPPCSA